MRVLEYCLLLAVCSPFALAADTVVTPEPGSATLLAIGVAGIAIASWRRRRSR